MRVGRHERVARQEADVRSCDGPCGDPTGCGKRAHHYIGACCSLPIRRVTCSSAGAAKLTPWSCAAPRSLPDGDDDPDRLYFSRGLGALDSDSDSGDGDSAGVGEGNDWGDDEVSS